MMGVMSTEPNEGITRRSGRSIHSVAPYDQRSQRLCAARGNQEESTRTINAIWSTAKVHRTSRKSTPAPPSESEHDLEPEPCDHVDGSDQQRGDDDECDQRPHRSGGRMPSGADDLTLDSGDARIDRSSKKARHPAERTDATSASGPVRRRNECDHDAGAEQHRANHPRKRRHPENHLVHGAKAVRRESALQVRGTLNLPFRDFNYQSCRPQPLPAATGS